MMLRLAELNRFLCHDTYRPRPSSYVWSAAAKGHYPMKCLLATPFALLLTGCVSTHVVASKTPCTSLIPAEWKEGVENAPLPPETDDELELLKGWVNFGVVQTGQLSKANGRTKDAIGIVERCVARDMEAIEAARPKFLGLF